MRALERILAVTLGLSLLVLGNVALGHAHAAATPSVSDADCPLLELASQAAALSPRVPLPASFDLPTPITLLSDRPALAVFRAPASSRAPPQR